MPYHIDYSGTSLDTMKKKLIDGHLVPSRKLLLIRIDQNFNALKNAGLTTVEALLARMRSKKKLAQLALETGITEQYLTILNREIRSTLPKIPKISEFPEIDPELVRQLKDQGIDNAKQLWERCQGSQGRSALAALTGIDLTAIESIVTVADLCRVRWVNPNFARMLQMAGIRDARALATADPIDLHARVNELNALHGWFRGKIGANDFRLVVRAAQDLSHDLDI